MTDERDTDAFEVSGFDDTDSIDLAIEGALDDTLELAALDPTDRIPLPRARTQPHWPPTPPPPRTSRRHRSVYAVALPQTSS